MRERTPQSRIQLTDGSTVAVIGGGPAGAFFAIHLLKLARTLQRQVQIIIFERRRAPGRPIIPCPVGGWRGCNYCAGGISPKLNDVLKELQLAVPEPIIQSRINSITIQGFWKNIELEVPPGREMLSVYRGSRPYKRSHAEQNFDAFLLDEAVKAGANLIGGEVQEVAYDEDGKPLLRYRLGEAEHRLQADFVVFAAGVNERAGIPLGRDQMLQCLQRLLPGFSPPRVRKALIVEFEAKPAVPDSLVGTIHFVEYGSAALPLEMCSVVPKQGFITVVLVGPCVDAASSHAQDFEIVKRFLALPHIHKLVSPRIRLSPVCLCTPNMVVGSAQAPFGDRVAAVGDVVTTRLYKDGILSACETARALAETVLTRGVDAASLQAGYGPTLQRFRRDNEYAGCVFMLHRLFFSSSVLSRILYQALINERKTTPAPRRHLEKILWRIASGDAAYRDIFFSMVHPATLWYILLGGSLITLRNYLTELAFGLRWEGFGRFTTGVALERFEEKHRQFSRLISDASVAVPPRPEFERMYTIKIGAPRKAVLEQLELFGEPDRGYLRPRGVRIQRTAGLPHAPGCVIRYEFFSPRFSFHLELEQLVGGHLAVYRVKDGFARGGVLIFEIEQLATEVCALSIYVAFNFARGRSWVSRPFWWLFRPLFPAFVHDVLWNHGLCQLKSLVETEHFQPPSAQTPLATAA